MYYGAEVTLGDTEAVGIEIHLSLAAAVFIYKGNELLVQVMLAVGHFCLRHVFAAMTAEDVIVDLSNDAYHVVQRMLFHGAVVGNVPCNSEELLQLSYLIRCDSEQKVWAMATEYVRQSLAEDHLHTLLRDSHTRHGEVTADFDRFDYSTWRNNNNHPLLYIIFLQIDDGAHVAFLAHSQSVVLYQVRSLIVKYKRLQYVNSIKHNTEVVGKDEMPGPAFTQLVEGIEHATEVEFLWRGHV